LGLDYDSTTFFDYFGLTYVNDGGDEEAKYLTGGANDLTSGLAFDYYGGHDPHYSLDRLEANGSELLFSSNEGYGRMLLYESEGYKAISSSIILGAIVSGDSLNLKPYLISEMVNYFLDFNPTTSLKENIAGLYSVQNSPNPFSAETRIDYSIKTEGQVQIDVFNVNGQLVKHLVDEKLLPGNHSVVWDATNTKGKKVESGFYFCKINSGGISQTEKMILLH